MSYVNNAVVINVILFLTNVNIFWFSGKIPDNVQIAISEGKNGRPFKALLFYIILKTPIPSVSEEIGQAILLETLQLLLQEKVSYMLNNRKSLQCF